MSVVIRDREDARWLPSRFDFAFFRLLAFLRLKTAKPKPRKGLALAVDRHQSAIENHIVSIIVFIVLAAFVASLFDVIMPFGAACALALPVAAVYINAHVAIGALTITPLVRKVSTVPSAIAITGAGLMMIVIAAATLLAVSASPLRYFGTAFLLLVAANAIAALIVFVMQRQIADIERRYGVES